MSSAAALNPDAVLGGVGSDRIGQFGKLVHPLRVLRHRRLSSSSIRWVPYYSSIVAWGITGTSGSCTANAEGTSSVSLQERIMTIFPA